MAPTSASVLGKEWTLVGLKERKGTMTEEAHLSVAEKGLRKRRVGRKKSAKAKKLKVFPDAAEKVKINKKMKKLFRKRARDYNSDDESGPGVRHEQAFPGDDMKVESGDSSDGERVDGEDVDTCKGEYEGEEDDEIQSGIIKFTEGSNAFKAAFKSIIKKSKADDALVS